MGSRKIQPALIVVVVFVFALMSEPLKAGSFCDFIYSENDGQITIDKYTGKGGGVDIPGKIDGKPVTEIGKKSFFNCTLLSAVTIPESVTVIGTQAFSKCSGLTGIIIPDSVTLIWEGAFSHCTGLKSISLPRNITEIRMATFTGCTGLTSVIIPDSVTLIGDLAFAGCNGLVSVTIPENVTAIGVLAFGDCAMLENITVRIENPSYQSIGGVLFSKDKKILVYYPSGKKERTYTIPGSVTELGWGAFSHCTLNSITIPASVTIIGFDAFSGCEGLTIKGYKNTYSERYAEKYKIPFRPVD